RHPLALAAGIAALTHLKDNGPRLQERLNARTDRLVADLNAVAREHNVPLHVVNCGSLMFFRVLEGQETSLLFYLLRTRGVYILEGFPSYLGTAHTDADLTAVVEAFRASAAELRAAGFVGTAAKPQAAGLVPLTDAQSEVWLAAQ